MYLEKNYLNRITYYVIKEKLSKNSKTLLFVKNNIYNQYGYVYKDCEGGDEGFVLCKIPKTFFSIKNIKSL